MPVAEIQGTSIAYNVRGEGRPLVFLHCWTGNQSFYFNQVGKFSSEYMCVTLDFPGHGESGTTDGEYSVERFGEMTLELLDRLGIEKAVFAGHSLGGMVALYLGLHHPDKVEGLILLDTTSHLSGFLFQRAGAFAATALGWFGSVVWNKGFKATKGLIAGLAATHPLAAPPPRIISARECSKVDNRPMARTLNRARNFNCTPRLGEITAPALIVVGNADVLADVRHANRMARGLPNSVMLVVKGAGHMALFEKPEVVNDEMQDFLSRVYPPVKPEKPARKKAKSRARKKKQPV